MSCDSSGYGVNRVILGVKVVYTYAVVYSLLFITLRS